MFLVDLSRLQFASTALFHFLFVPLTLGLSFLIVIMETLYVVTGKQVWKDAARFWAKLFAINFAMGVATGIPMEFQFGTNWAYYSHYVGDIFGVPLAIEGLMAFFLESTFVGIMLFGWDRIGKKTHLFITTMVALGSGLSALWILIANGWMQHPVGSYFNPDTMRMELQSLYTVLFNPIAQAKFAHTLTSGYVLGSIFVLSISSYYLIKGKSVAIAKRSAVVAATFGLIVSISVMFFGDQSGYLATKAQPMKMAAFESIWQTQAPASFNVFAWPSMSKHKNIWSLQIPYGDSIVLTRTLKGKVQGINNIVNQNKIRIRNGLSQYKLLERIKNGTGTQIDKDHIKNNYKDLGYALLLKRYRQDILNSTDEQIDKAAWSTVPEVLPLFYIFRAMVALGVLLFIVFLVALYTFVVKNKFNNKFLLRCFFWALPLPWIAIEFGWFVAEYGRQPWTIQGILPTFLSASDITVTDISISFIAFIILYTSLLIIDIVMMVKYIKLGPEYLYDKKYEEGEK